MPCIVTATTGAALAVAAGVAAGDAGSSTPAAAGERGESDQAGGPQHRRGVRAPRPSRSNRGRRVRTQGGGSPPAIIGEERLMVRSRRTIVVAAITAAVLAPSGTALAATTLHASLREVRPRCQPAANGSGSAKITLQGSQAPGLLQHHAAQHRRR